MKPFLLLTLLLNLLTANSQITTAVNKAGFGVDGELRTNFFNGFIQSGSDDWFNQGTAGTGQFVIDTNGASRMVARYAADPNFRRLPFFRTMRVPQFSIINNRLWIDAVYIRDYNGQAGGDSTAFVMSNKNGDSPQAWNGGVTSVLDKNDIAEMMIHVRRAGPNKTDSLWFMGGISLQGTSGNRYFDFELYQTDIFYTRSTGQFSNYGPDAGHTSWKFDAAGNVTAPGDVIFTAEYSSSSLTFLEARIWVHISSLSIIPAGFDWVGGFEGAGAGATYGYANIRPKTVGAYYTGLQSGNNTWAGPYGFINSGNTYMTTYTARQFMEFSVNLSKLGLDPMTLLGGSACGLPFRRILVKTRTSTSFSSELKDFIGPFDFFQVPVVQAGADVPMYCGEIGVSEISVLNPASASVYTWTTPNGNIISGNSGTRIIVDTPGTYIVTQQLLDGCSAYSADTVVIFFDSTCVAMNTKLSAFRGQLKGRVAHLGWEFSGGAELVSFEVMRSADGVNFIPVDTLPYFHGAWKYASEDNLYPSFGSVAYYQLRLRMSNGSVSYSRILRLELGSQREMNIYPNPVKDEMNLSISADTDTEAVFTIYNVSGMEVLKKSTYLRKGQNLVEFNTQGLPSGMYLVNVISGQATISKKFQILNAAPKIQF